MCTPGRPVDNRRRQRVGKRRPPAGSVWGYLHPLTLSEEQSPGYREAFLKEGINSWADNRNGFLQTREIRVITAFLQMLDNPYRDIPLLTVLMSDLFGFRRRGSPKFVC